VFDPGSSATIVLEPVESDAVTIADEDVAVEDVVEQDLLVEDISIDGMCGVY
jgi:mycofactocin precursor